MNTATMNSPKPRFATSYRHSAVRSRFGYALHLDNHLGTSGLEPAPKSPDRRRRRALRNLHPGGCRPKPGRRGDHADYSVAIASISLCRRDHKPSSATMMHLPPVQPPYDNAECVLPPSVRRRPADAEPVADLLPWRALGPSPH